MTINIYVLKGDLNGKIVVVRFFFCRVYQKFVWYLSVLVSNTLKKSLSKSLKFGPKWQFLYLKPILVAIFVTMAR